MVYPMLKIYDFNKNPIGYILKYKDLKVESELSTADKTLSFTYLAKTHEILEEYYIRTETDEYVVKQVKKSSRKETEVEAVLNTEELDGKSWQKFTVKDVTAGEAARLAVTGTGWRVVCSMDKLRSLGVKNVSAKVVLQKICVAYMCEMRLDSLQKIIYLQEEFGEDKGAYFLSDLNLKDISLTSDTYDYYTRIIPVGKDGLKITDVNGGKEYLENYQYTNKVLEYVWEDTSYEDAQALKDDAAKKLDDLSKPQKAYSGTVWDLAKSKPEYSILSYGLGDTVWIIDNNTGIRDRQRITKLTEYPQEPIKNTCEMSNTYMSFEEYQQQVQEAASLAKSAIDGDGTINGANIDTITIAQILNFYEEVRNASDLDLDKVETDIQYVKQELVAVKGQIGTLEVNALTAEEADLRYATIQNLNATNAEVETIKGRYAEFETTITEEIEAQNGTINNLSGNLSNFQTSVSQELITAKGWMLEGAIGDAQISSVSANKMRSGTIDTALITIAGSEGKLQIADNTLQIKDATRVRVQVGKDASGDYSMSVWDASGNLIWDALGATDKTIQRKIIRDSVVADDANIQGSKLDINSVIRSVNGATEKISSTVVNVGDKSLTALLQEQENTLTEHGETLSDHTAKIEANQESIALKVSSQEFTTYKTTVTQDIEAAKETAISTAATDASKKADAAKSAAISTAAADATTKADAAKSAAVTTAAADAKNKADAAKSAAITAAAADATQKADAAESAAVTTAAADATTKANNAKNAAITAAAEDATEKADAAKNAAVTAAAADAAAKAAQALEDAKGYTDGEIEVVSKSLSTATAEITALKGQIALKVEQTDIDSAIAEVNGKFASYSTTTQMTAAINAAKDSITSTVSKTYATQATVSTLSGKVTTLENWKTEASQKITDDAIISTVTKSTQYTTLEEDVTTAKNNAASAVTTANAASSAATGASNTANTAKTTADTAKKTADTASSNASSAVTTANAASSAASAAASTANAAKTTATEAKTLASQTADKFTWIVASGTSATNFTLTDKMVSLVTDKMVIKDSTGAKTIISGGRMDINQIFAQDITATGTIRGATLIGGSIKSNNAVEGKEGTILQLASGDISTWHTYDTSLYKNVTDSTLIGSGKIILRAPDGSVMSSTPTAPMAETQITGYKIEMSHDIDNEQTTMFWGGIQTSGTVMAKEFYEGLTLLSSKYALKTEVNALSSNIAYVSKGTFLFNSGWGGSIVYLTSSRGPNIIKGQIVYSGGSVPNWGSSVGRLTDLTNFAITGWLPLHVFRADGVIINSFTLCGDGNIRVYNPDLSQINNQTYYFCIVF